MRPTSRRLLEAALREYHHGEVQDEVLGEHCYRCNQSRLPPELSKYFIQLSTDEETRAFLCESKHRANNVCLQLMYALVQVLLGLFISQTSINGLLERGRMFIFSQQHLRHLLSSLPPPSSPSTLILDIGSGDGHVTDKLRGVFGGTIHVTETSGVMQRILRKKGYRVVDVECWHNQPHMYDLISCLNVLDRCDCPLDMLRRIHGKLQSGGLLLLALVLPYRPFVEKGPWQHDPTEVLPVALKEGEGGWEEGIGALWTNVLCPLGFTPVAVTRLPYLCEGDLHRDFYYLDDAVLVLRKN